MDVVRLIQAAMAARDNAYAPYSQCGVGAALLTQGGRTPLSPRAAVPNG